MDTAATLDPEADQLRAKLLSQPLTRPGELARAWLGAGLTAVTQDMKTIRMDFADFADFWAPCEGRDGPVASYVGKLEPGAKALLREAVRRAYQDGEADGPRSYAATAWVIRGKVP